jgi:hypothetical protein
LIDKLFQLQNLVPPNPLSKVWFWHIMVLFIQLHHCLGLLPTPHGVDGIEVKQIAKQNFYLWILFPTLLVFLHGHIVPPQICTNYYVFEITYSFMFFFIPFVANLQG